MQLQQLSHVGQLMISRSRKTSQKKCPCAYQANLGDMLELHRDHVVQ